MKLLDLFDFCKKFHLCIFDHFLQTYNYLELKFANFVQKLTHFTGVQNSRAAESAPQRLPWIGPPQSEICFENTEKNTESDGSQ